MEILTGPNNYQCPSITQRIRATIKTLPIPRTAYRGGVSSAIQDEFRALQSDKATMFGGWEKGYMFLQIILGFFDSGLDFDRFYIRAYFPCKAP